ncbi:SURF1 family protein [Vibrio sp.]|uniref:SURF1 family protein n=1 Tax=Vibrio sp. TaxID=678 RepID=UPI00311FC542
MTSSLFMSLKSGSVWVGMILTLVVFSILVNLGLWQFGRYQKKNEIEQKLLAREQSTTVEMDDLHLVGVEYLTGIKISAELVPIDGRYLLLDNQVYKGEVGYLAYQLMESETGIAVLLERGFIPAGKDRSKLPQVSWITTPISLAARLYQRSVNPLSDRLYMETDRPHRIQNLNIEELGELWGRNIQPYLIQPVVDDWPYPQPWQPLPLSSSKHLGYAVQWFGMATALLVLTLWIAVRLFKSKE